MPTEPGEHGTFRTISQQAYWLTFSDPAEQTSDFDYLALGPHSIPGAYCENCNRPFHRLLSLDCRDPRLSLSSLPLPQLHLLFCPTCEQSPWPFRYGIRDDGSVAVFEHGQGGRSDEFPSPDYPTHIPAQAVSFAAVAAPEQSILRQLNQRGENYDQLCDFYGDDLGNIRHQFGGEPFLIQLTANPPCTLCRQPMSFVAALGDDIAPAPGFVANCGVQMLYYFCPACAVIECVQECD